MLYDLLCSVNARLIMGESFTDEERRSVVDGICSSRDLRDFISVSARTFGAPDAPGRSAMYPTVFMPSVEERAGRLRLITGELPKTRLLSDNAYELEIMRLLSLWARGQPVVEAILQIAEARTRGTPFSSFCAKGERPGVSVAFLRFWTAYRPDDLEKQREIIHQMRPFSRARDSGQGSWVAGLNVPKFYLLSALNECAYPVVEEELRCCASLLLRMLKRPWLDEPYSLLRKHVVRTALSRIPEYAYVSRASFHVGDDGRWHAAID
jgi:hypothetical protein